MEHLLLRLGVPEERFGSGEVGATSDVLTAYELLDEHGALVLGAHVNSTHGIAMQGLRFGGQTKIAYTQDEHLHGLEVTDLMLDGGRRSTARFFNGTKAEYPRRMHCLQGSDAHRLTQDPNRATNLGIGDRATEVELAEVSFGALKGLFLSDHFDRVRGVVGQSESVQQFRDDREQGDTEDQAFHETLSAQRGGPTPVMRDLVALANGDGGMIYVGASADPDRPVAGIGNADAVMDDLRAELTDRITPTPEVEIESLSVDNRTVVVLRVLPGTEKPYALSSGSIVVRDGGTTVSASRDRIVTMVRETSLSPSSAPAARDAAAERGRDGQERRDGRSAPARRDARGGRDADSGQDRDGERASGTSGLTGSGRDRSGRRQDGRAAAQPANPPDAESDRTRSGRVAAVTASEPRSAPEPRNVRDRGDRSSGGRERTVDRDDRRERTGPQLRGTAARSRYDGDDHDDDAGGSEPANDRGAARRGERSGRDDRAERPDRGGRTSASRLDAYSGGGGYGETVDRYDDDQADRDREEAERIDRERAAAARDERARANRSQYDEPAPRYDEPAPRFDDQSEVDRYVQDGYALDDDGFDPLPPGISPNGGPEEHLTAAPDRVSPTSGVEILAAADVDGVPFFTLHDLRHEEIIRNVTPDTGRRLWRYAIEQFEDLDAALAGTRWDGDYGFVKSYRPRGGERRYNLALRGGGEIRVFFGVSDEDIPDGWRSVLPARSGR